MAWTRFFSKQNTGGAAIEQIKHIPPAHLTPADRRRRSTMAASPSASSETRFLRRAYRPTTRRRMDQRVSRQDRRMARAGHRPQRPAVQTANLRRVCRVELFDACSLAEHQCVGDTLIRESLVLAGFVMRVDHRFQFRGVSSARPNQMRCVRPHGRFRLARSCQIVCYLRRW